MANSCIETSAAPAWLSKLESQREKLGKAKLGHDSGAGAACNNCGPDCPGLDLHFWRKECRACRCSKDVHDVQDSSGWAQFELLGTARPKRSNSAGIADGPVKLEWVPPNTSPELVSDYMSCLGGGLAPVAGSDGAIRRREQLRRQVPLHDVSVDLCMHNPTKEEMDSHKEYISQIKQQVVGVGNIVRVGKVQNTFTVGKESSQPVPGTKSYSLPLKLSNLNTGVRFANIPKNGTDKLLVLDSMGNVVNKSAHLQNYMSSPILSRIVKDKLISMRIESDRVKSAVEYGPVYDRLFNDLRQLNVPIDNDVYLYPIKSFRDEYNVNPMFKGETTAFVESLGGQVMANPNALNNNANSPDSQISVNCYPQKGTIFAPNGEIWSWSSQAVDPAKSVSIKNTNPHFMSSTDNVGALNPQHSEMLSKQNALNKSYEDGPEMPPPMPNYNTYPGAIVIDTDATKYPPVQTKQNINKNMPEYGTGRLPQHATSGYVDHMNKSGFGNVNDSKLHTPHTNATESMIDSIGSLHMNDPEYHDSSYSVPCQRCQLSIEEGQIAVKAERAGDEDLWHPQCFSCVICKELLADLFYFYHAGEIYCGRDLAEVLSIPRCSACDELIFSKSYTAAENKIFHVDHFCCYHCDTPLGGQQYVPDEKTGQPVCLICYEKFHAEKCHYCKSAIRPEQQGVSWKDFHWHGTCFNCTGKICGKSLLGSKFIVRNDVPFCSSACAK